MSFISYSYIVFLLIVFVAYWLVAGRSLKWQNVILLVSGYVFYGWWSYRFLGLLMFSSLLDYFIGLRICRARTNALKKRWLVTSVVLNLGFLAVFKYYNFFVQEALHGLAEFGVHTQPWLLHVVLPVGISFYTFHGLSYVFDIYRNKIEPSTNPVEYGVFVCFFPLLVAGPIERASHLLPQIKSPRLFSYSQAVDGLRQILWGVFKKAVVADNCAIWVDMVFNGYDHYSGSTLVLGAILFSVQIYGDFSGYTDIATGSAKLLGFTVVRNFAFPYFSRDIAEFWRRWHISLSSWFRDYVYFPMGGSRGTLLNKVRNVLIIFMLSGLWHGANWTFIVWGALNAIYFIPLFLLKRNRDYIDIVAPGNWLPTLRETVLIVVTFLLTAFAWIFFRSPTVSDAFGYVGRMISPSLFTVVNAPPRIAILLCIIFLTIEWLGRGYEYALQGVRSFSSRTVRWSFYYLIIAFVFLFTGKAQQFIYFQF